MSSFWVYMLLNISFLRQAFSWWPNDCRKLIINEERSGHIQARTTFFVHFQLTSFPGAFKNSARCSTHVHNEQLTEKTLQNKLLEMD